MNMKQILFTQTLFTIISILQMVFIALKLINIITWAWPIVLIPFWVAASVMILISIIVCFWELISKPQ